MRRFIACLLPGLMLALASARADTLQLDAAKAVELAMKNNLAIQAASAKLEEAAAGKGAAFGAFLPQVSASSSYYRMAKVNEFTMMTPKYGMFPLRVYDFNGQIIGLTDSIPMVTGADTLKLKLGNANNYTLRGTVQQTLFTWGKLINAYKIAGLSFDMQKEAMAQARAQVKVDATSGFYQALLAQRMAGLLRESYDQLKRHVDRAQALYDNGLATKLDVMRAKVGLTNMEAQVSQLENAAALALATLRNTIGAPPETELELAGELKPETTGIALEAAIDSALRRRPELAQLRDAVGMSVLGERIAGTSNLPTAFAAFNYDYKRPVGFTDEWGSDWNATVGVSMPIFTGGTNLNRWKQAKARVRQTRIALAQVEDGIRLEVQAQHSALSQESKNITYQARNVEVAEQALQLAETRYQNGLLTNLEYMDTQLALMQSRVSYLSALANYRIVRAKLLKAVGEY